MTFSGDLLTFADRAGLRANQTVRKVAFDLTRDLVQATPVDTGLARSNYFLGNDPVDSTDTTASTNGAPSLGRAAQFAATLAAGGTFYITNNLPYIMALEYGSSKQAANGMARIVVARWQEIVNKAVGKMSQSARLEAIDSTNEQRGFKR